MAQTVDRRVKRTKRQLTKALTKLLLEKSLKDISVLELTELADINRGTFYLHYKDIYDLYEQIENEIINEFNSIIKTNLNQNKKGVPFPLVLKTLEFLKENSDICKAILLTNDTAFLSSLIEGNRPEDDKTWEALFGKQNKGLYEYCYSYITSGCIGLIKSWFMGGMKEPPETIAALAERLMSKSY